MTLWVFNLRFDGNGIVMVTDLFVLQKGAFWFSPMDLHGKEVKCRFSGPREQSIIHSFRTCPRSNL